MQLINRILRLSRLMTLAGLTACQSISSPSPTLYEQTNLTRFRNKLVEHLCQLSDGPCEYTGDSMRLTHGGMNISESEFNRGVDLMIEAMNRAGVSLSARNQLLARMTRFREQIVYQ